MIDSTKVSKWEALARDYVNEQQQQQNKRITRIFVTCGWGDMDAVRVYVSASEGEIKPIMLLFIADNRQQW